MIWIISGTVLQDYFWLAGQKYYLSFIFSSKNKGTSLVFNPSSSGPPAWNFIYEMPYATYVKYLKKLTFCSGICLYQWTVTGWKLEFAPGIYNWGYQLLLISINSPLLAAFKEHFLHLLVHNFSSSMDQLTANTLALSLQGVLYNSLSSWTWIIISFLCQFWDKHLSNAHFLPLIFGWHFYKIDWISVIMNNCSSKWSWKWSSSLNFSFSRDPPRKLQTFSKQFVMKKN